jgi:peptidoglycan-associated lipoprotein
MELKTVYFDFDKYDIKPEFKDAIKYNAQQLNKDKSVKVTVEGHCDERGSTEYNLALGERRATAVQKALVADGVDGKRLKVVSYGEERPVDPGHDETAWAKNRRSALSQ